MTWTIKTLRQVETVDRKFAIESSILSNMLLKGSTEALTHQV